MVEAAEVADAGSVDDTSDEMQPDRMNGEPASQLFTFVSIAYGMAISVVFPLLYGATAHFANFFENKPETGLPLTHSISMWFDARSMNLLQPYIDKLLLSGVLLGLWIGYFLLINTVRNACFAVYSASQLAVDLLQATVLYFTAHSLASYSGPRPSVELAWLGLLIASLICAARATRGLRRLWGGTTSATHLEMQDQWDAHTLLTVAQLSAAAVSVCVLALLIGHDKPFSLFSAVPIAAATFLLTSLMLRHAAERIARSSHDELGKTIRWGLIQVRPLRTALHLIALAAVLSAWWLQSHDPGWATAWENAIPWSPLLLVVLGSAAWYFLRWCYRWRLSGKPSWDAEEVCIKFAHQLADRLHCQTGVRPFVGVLSGESAAAPPRADPRPGDEQEQPQQAAAAPPAVQWSWFGPAVRRRKRVRTALEERAAQLDGLYVTSVARKRDRSGRRQLVSKDLPTETFERLLPQIRPAMWALCIALYGGGDELPRRYLMVATDALEWDEDDNTVDAIRVRANEFAHYISRTLELPKEALTANA